LINLSSGLIHRECCSIKKCVGSIRVIKCVWNKIYVIIINSKMVENMGSSSNNNNSFVTKIVQVRALDSMATLTITLTLTTKLTTKLTTTLITTLIATMLNTWIKDLQHH